MLRFHPKLLASSSLTFFNLSSFSRISKKNLVPKLFKDPKFTRTGYNKKKNKSLQYDLSKTYIINPHLYYDEKNDKIMKRKEYKLRKNFRNEYPLITKETKTEHLLNNLNDDYLLSRGSGRILNVILELEERDPVIIEENKELIKRALRKISEKLVFFNLREYGILVTLSSRYDGDNKQLWNQFTLNFMRLLEKKKYYNESLIDTKIKEKNFVFIFNNIYRASVRHNIEITQVMNNMKELLLDKFDTLSSISHTILFMTTLVKNKKAKQEGKDFLMKLLPKLNEKINIINEKDSLALIQSMVALDLLDFPLINQLETKVLKALEEEKEPNQRMIHHFCMLCQSISHAHKYKSQLFPEFATKYFQQHKDKVKSTLDITFLTDSFSKMKITTREIYKSLEKLINERILNLPFENCDQLLISAQRRYENFSMVFLSYLASRFDTLFQNPRNFSNLKPAKALQVVNLMNLVKEKNRTSKFEMYDNLISLIETESFKEQNKAEEKGKIKEEKK